MKNNCIIGHTGFVGSNLIRHFNFDFLYNSKNIHQIQDKKFDLVVCCGIQAQKWWANLNEKEDLENIKKLTELLKTVKCNRFILISTTDVYNDINNGHDEDAVINPDKNNPYGRNRYYAERFVIDNFDNYHIIRLGGLFGFGLKKNLIYDLVNEKNPSFNNKSKFQWYYLNDLKKDIEYCIENNIRTLNLFNEPVSMGDVVDVFSKFKTPKYTQNNIVVSYDLKTKYKSSGYFNSKDIVMKQLYKYLWTTNESKICISNLGYDLNEYDKIKKIEQFYSIKSREIVPYKTFGEKFEYKNLDYFDMFKDMNIYSMQSILYPHNENILKLEEYFIKLIDIASYLNVKILVFGSAKNRNINDMKQDEFVSFMKKMGDYAFSKNVVIVAEPNARQYNCNFIVNSHEALNIIRLVDSDGFKLHLDTGCMFLEGENILDVIVENIKHIYHIHFSAPNLDNLFVCNDIDYKGIIELLVQLKYSRFITLETLNKTPDEIDRSLFHFMN